MLDTGTSGGAAKLVVVIPFLMFVLPTRITRIPSPSSSRSRSGNAAPPCETRIAGPFSFAESVGVFALTPPTNEPDGHVYGFALNTASEHAFCSVVSREGSCLGSCTSTDLTFEPPAGTLSVVSRLAPLAFEVFAPAADPNDGLNASAPQLLTWNGIDVLCVAPSVDVSVVSVASAPQLLGLRRNPCLLISTLIPRRRRGMPL